MAQFRATIQGQRGEASRLGSKSSGLRVECNGWNAGVRVVAEYDTKNECDKFYVYRTGGSNDHGYPKLVATIDGQGVWEPVL